MATPVITTFNPLAIQPGVPGMTAFGMETVAGFDVLHGGLKPSATSFCPGIFWSNGSGGGSGESQSTLTRSLADLLLRCLRKDGLQGTPRVLEVGFGFEHSVIDSFLVLDADVTASDVLFDARKRLAFSHKHAVDAGKLHIGLDVVNDTSLDGKYDVIVFNMPSPFGEMPKMYIELANKFAASGSYLVIQTERPELFIDPFKNYAEKWEEIFAGDANGKHILPTEYSGEAGLFFAIFMRRYPAATEDPKPATGLEQAKSIAQHSQSVAELDILAKNQHLIHDSVIQRHLLKNPITPPHIFVKIFQTMSMFDIFNIIGGHEVTEAAKSSAREQLRVKFRQASAEACAQFIIRTEGRCLLQLLGETFTKETVDELCKHNFTSLLLVRSLTVFPALPPALIRHLLKQAIVQRNKEMKSRLLHNANCPADAKQKV